MIPLFLGLTAANLILLTLVFGVGRFAVADGVPTGLYYFHVALGIATGMIATLTHLVVYTYFMATSRWLQAAANKANLDLNRFVVPALTRKSRALPVVMAAVAAVMLTMFSGAAADSTVRPWWPGEVHLVTGAFAIGINILCAAIEYRLIRGQGDLMDQALVAVNLMQPSSGSQRAVHP
jgi:hypothetical protein